MVSAPSVPSTPRETPPLNRGARAEVEAMEREEVVEEPVALVVTPRPTSEEEEDEVGRMRV